MCRGGFPKDRFVTTADGETGLNDLCPGFKRSFTHALPYAVRIGSARLSERGSGAPDAGAAPERLAGVGRNAPGPCGSGRKFKQCCLDRSRA